MRRVFHHQPVRLLAATLAILLATPIRAQLIEISLEARDPNLGAAHAVIVLDTTAEPIANTATTVTFDVFDASLSVDFADFYPHGPGHTEPGERREATGASITYSTQLREIRVTLEAPGAWLTFEVDAPVGPFHPYMTALPSDPTAYLFDGFDDQRVHAAFSQTTENPTTGEQTTLAGASSWTPATGFTGALAYTVRVLPEPQRCSEADLAPPFGIVDFDDVLAFIDAFNHACP